MSDKVLARGEYIPICDALGCMRVPELLLLIIYWTRSCDYNDIYTLQSMSMTCKEINKIMNVNRKNINEYYTVKTENNGGIHYKLGDLYHRDDGPAIITAGGSQYYYRYGNRHRDEDQPAIIYTAGQKEWWINGRLHRDGGPAVVYTDGSEDWYQHGKLHRDCGPAVTRKNTKDVLEYWYQYGKRHRDDGPAVIYANGRKEWYQHDRLHRDIGPAVTYETILNCGNNRVVHTSTIEYYNHGKLYKSDTRRL